MDRIVHLARKIPSYSVEDLLPIPLEGRVEHLREEFYPVSCPFWYIPMYRLIGVDPREK